MLTCARLLSQMTSTVAALTRERDALQRRVHELSVKLAAAVGKEGAARGAQALRSATWRRNAAAAEAKWVRRWSWGQTRTEAARSREGRSWPHGGLSASMGALLAMCVRTYLAYTRTNQARTRTNQAVLRLPACVS